MNSLLTVFLSFGLLASEASANQCVFRGETVTFTASDSAGDFTKKLMTAVGEACVKAEYQNCSSRRFQYQVVSANIVDGNVISTSYQPELIDPNCYQDEYGQLREPNESRFKSATSSSTQGSQDCGYKAPSNQQNSPAAADPSDGHPGFNRVMTPNQGNGVVRGDSDGRSSHRY